MTVLLQLILSLTPKIYLRDTDCIKYEYNINIPLRFSLISFVFATQKIQLLILLQNCIKIVILHKLKKFLFFKFNLLLYFYSNKNLYI